MVQCYGIEHRTPNNLESESLFNEFGENRINQQSSSPSSSSSVSSSATIESNSNSISMVTSTIAYICIITDMTDASNTCRRHVINLSSTYKISSLIQEAGNFYSYEPSSFYLMWKNAGELLNISELNTETMTLGELGLTTPTKNIFEIHEKEGPPKRIKIDTYNNELPNLEPINYPSIPMSSMSRRNASNDLNEYGPVNNPFNNDGLNFYPTYNNLNPDNDNMGYVGLINQAMTCYLNSLLQTLFMTPEFRNGIYRWNFNEINEDDGKKSIPFQLQRLFLNLQTSNKKSIQTSDLTKSFGWNSDDAFQQHDVQELCRVMFDALEKNFKGTQQENLINELYQGKIKDYVKCLECNIESARVNVFLDISLCIRPFGSNKTYESVEEALDAFVQPEILDENNKYYCDKCNKMCKAHKGLKFESFPYIISLQLNRFDFDYSTMSRFKISNTVSFPEIMNVKKYLNLPVEKENSIENIYNDYELFSIMIHSGSATGGHYYAYIKCFETNEWFNFNDERVTKLDKRDINKAFGTSYSSYSSTTAYMLLYRQINPNRNEKFIKTEELNDYLQKLFEKEKNQQLEADRLKEYMENSCKIKVVIPSKYFINNEISSLVDNKESINNKNKEKLVNLHKDLTLEQAKFELIKEFSLNESFDLTKNKFRILKYDTYNDLIEESYKNESTNTVFEALGFTKYPYGLCWYLEILPIDDEFFDYNSNDFNIKVFNLNMTTFETSELFNIRLKNDSTVMELKEQISKELYNKTKKNSPLIIRMALERSHSLHNFVYLNKNLSDSLKSQSFTRVNKVFIEYEKTDEEKLDLIETNNNEINFNKSLEYSKFSYALDAIMNMLQMIVFLPIEEQCEMFLRKTQRRYHYIEKQRKLKQTDKNNTNITANNKTNDIHTQSVESDFITTSGYNIADNLNKKLIDDDSISRMSIQYEENNNMNLIEDHFKYNLKNIQNEMETSFDEGIGESTISENNNNKLMNEKITNKNYENLNHLTKNRDLDQINIETGEIVTQDKNDDNIHDEWDGFDDLDVNVDDNEINNIDDFNENTNLNTNDENRIDGDDISDDHILKSSEMVVGYEVNINNLMNDKEPKNDLNDINDGIKSDEFKIRPKSVKFFSHTEEINFVDNDNLTKGVDNDSKIPIKSSILRSINTYNNIREDLPKYNDLNSESYVKHDFVENKQEFNETKNNRFIKSNLISNSEIGASTLEIRMDKRIDLNEFKSHINEYLKIGNDNFRVFRMCPNDLECELTSYENQFSYITQNTKFVIKLGPPLKYGEYVLPIFMLNKEKGSFSYLCDFMIVHGLSVFNHKELLKDDLKDECDLDIDVKRMRLRKKISKKPGTILLDNDVFGVEIFMNAMSELFIEVLEEEDKKNSKSQTSIYLRHWKPDEYILSDLIEIVIDGNTLDELISTISKISGISIKDLELLKCKRDFPFKSPILDLHKDLAWKDNYSLQMEKLEDGICFYFRNKSLKLGELSEEKRREMAKEDNLNFKPTLSVGIKKEIGIKIHVEDS